MYEKQVLNYSWYDLYNWSDINTYWLVRWKLSYLQPSSQHFGGGHNTFPGYSNEFPLGKKILDTFYEHNAYIFHNLQFSGCIPLRCILRRFLVAQLIHHNPTNLSSHMQASFESNEVQPDIAAFAFFHPLNNSYTKYNLQELVHSFLVDIHLPLYLLTPARWFQGVEHPSQYLLNLSSLALWLWVLQMRILINK